MVLKNAKATDIGVIIPAKEKYTLLIPLKFAFSDNLSKKTRFDKSINREIFFLLNNYFTRYTIIFDKSPEKKQLRFVTYLAAPTQQKLALKAGQALKRLQAHFKEYSITTLPDRPKEFLSEIKNKIPQTITNIERDIYQVKSKKNDLYFLAIAKIVFTSKKEEQDLPFFINDFLSLITKGKIAIDVSNLDANITKTTTSKVAITVILEDTNQVRIIHNQKKLHSLLQLFIDQYSSAMKRQSGFISREELLANFGRIIFSQGWSFFSTDFEGALDFASFFDFFRS
jgi:hypothetical protein